MIQIRHQAIFIVLTIMFILLVGVTNSYAIPVQGVVDPGSNWASTLTGTATYTFTNLVGGLNAPMVSLQLGFGADVFNLSATSIIPSSISSGWGLVTLPLANGTYELALLAGSPISAGSSLSFSAAYSLIGSALVNGVNPWNQYFGVVYGGLPLIGGGETSIKTPEASSLILLVSALAGLALWKRRQKSFLTTAS